MEIVQTRLAYKPTFGTTVGQSTAAQSTGLQTLQQPLQRLLPYEPTPVERSALRAAFARRDGNVLFRAIRHDRGAEHGRAGDRFADLAAAVGRKDLLVERAGGFGASHERAVDGAENGLDEERRGEDEGLHQHG
ncbi:hypothetical protein HK104_001817 [Borealophlyctis nickersoniae]|nr:hypothetical protein HK104_001817 [Borealophlyctis nickersoniae]